MITFCTSTSTSTMKRKAGCNGPKTGKKVKIKTKQRVKWPNGLRVLQSLQLKTSYQYHAVWRFNFCGRGGIEAALRKWASHVMECTRSGTQKPWRKKRKYDLGHTPGNTKLDSTQKTVRRIRVRGGNVKWRALRLSTGNFSWGSEATTRKTRILEVVYNSSNNELVRTQTLVKSAIVQVDGAPFKQWYLTRYGVDIGKKMKLAAKKDEPEGEAAAQETKRSNQVMRKIEKRQAERKIDQHVEEQFGSGRLMACISSRPGQCGRSDGYILEGKELEFYMKKLQKKKGKAAGSV